jgi:8-amino-7-oxononanoate synthase
MSLITQALDRIRSKADGTSQARPFSDLSAHKVLSQGKKIAAMLGIESPFFRSTEGMQGRKTLIDGRPVLNFAWCDYLGLSQHPELIAAAKAAVDQYGTTVSASRMVSGDTPVHRGLEKEIAEFIGVDDAIVFVGGHAANVSTIGTVMTDRDLIVHDEFVHNSAMVGIRLSGATARSFHHNRLDKLEVILREERAKYRNCLVVIEGLYSTEGDVPDLARVVEIKDKYGAWLMVDDAHGAGVLGRGGRGLAEHCGVDARKVDIWMGTLSKTFASVGGYIAGNNELIEVLKHSAPGFVFSVGLPPSMGAAALTALRVIKREPERVARLHENGALFLSKARECGLDTGRSLGFGMLPIMVGASTRAARLVHRMYDRGINTSLIIYPGVPMNAGRLRFFLTSEFAPDEIRLAVQTAKEEITKV